jgi:drug/metabolite transporter (DMT)-like permease
MTAITVVMMGAWLIVREPQALRLMLSMPGPCTFLGIVSALGTIFWFFASALTNAAYVAAVTQVQIAFSLVISRFYFDERIRGVELIGIAIILVGVLIFRFV